MKQLQKFVLPEIWWVRITEENLKDVCEFLGFELSKRIVGNVAGMLKHYRTGEIKKGWNGKPTTDYGSTFGNEITTEQFRKYVLKKEPVVLEEPKDKVLQAIELLGKGITIVQVQCSEGGIYKIGDKITVFDKTSPNKGKPFTIEGFRWNNAKTKLCAITELHTPNGIGLDKIELHIEPKVEPKQELSLLEQAKQPLFTTEDGVDIFEGDKYYYINSNFNNPREIINTKADCPKIINKNDLNYKRFSTKETAEEYVLMNKPCLSLNDIFKDVEELRDGLKTFENSELGKRFKKLVQQKIKQIN